MQLTVSVNVPSIEKQIVNAIPTCLPTSNPSWAFTPVNINKGNYSTQYPPVYLRQTPTGRSHLSIETKAISQRNTHLFACVKPLLSVHTCQYKQRQLVNAIPTGLPTSNPSWAFTPVNEKTGTFVNNKSFTKYTIECYSVLYSGPIEPVESVEMD